MVNFERRQAGKALLGVLLALALILIGLPRLCLADAGVEDRLAVCAGIEEDAARLQCFDELAGRGKPARSAAQAEKPSAPPDRVDAPERVRLSVMTKLWDLDPDHRSHSFVIRPHRMNYFLPVAYNSSPNDEANLEYDPAAKAQHNEAKFQISFKAKIWEDMFQDSLQGVYDRVKVIRGADMWIAYTQLCFWQLYNSAFSSPFRDTNYEPEMLLNLRTDYDLLGFKGRFVQVGLNHQSNGRSRPLSRSWNRVVANIGLERNEFALQLKTWYRLPEDESKDDNSDILRYMGYGELWASYFWKKQRFAVMLRNNLRRENLGAVQLEWSIPPLALGQLLLGSVVSEETLNKYLTDKFSFYVQYFNGYGEGLMDYNKSMNRISFGVMIAEWN
ncbi:MAG TPA: phospholipase A [Smithellaceae bacterium]|nr:phospholipase A [Smithellaceae bacterium]HOH57225.1 phospholipase A [Smithellaceae bacterium]HPY07002.1 phospholipase A [Smithellaceae bacterium]HQC10342.1 phospholipase A [Smithellaceae bacterium]HQN68054.1 phospholipase A [Smithellaceae bacterium]